MNKSMLIGIAAGVAVATAGGVVAGYQLFGKSADEEAQDAGYVAQTPQAAALEECWEEEVTVQAEARDSNRIAGTAIGAILGGAVARDVGDRDLTTAAGAAVGAAAGRRAQREFQENRTTTETEIRCAPVQQR